jgi:hypothetical protein
MEDKILRSVSMFILRFSALVLLLLLLQPRTVQAQAITYAEPGSMTFVLLDTSSICADCTVVQATGRFDRETIRAYNDLVWRHTFRQNTYFVFDSPGGNRDEAMQLGVILRNLNAYTVVGQAVVRGGRVEIEPGRCASACVLAFIGGARRGIPKAAQLGVHSGAPAFLAQWRDEDRSHYSKPLALDDIMAIHRSTADYLQHLDAMGIDLRVAIPTLRTSFRSISWLSPEAQAQWKLVTADPILTAPADGTPPALLLSPMSRTPGRPPKEADGRQRKRERR